jgi:hypothetical protein
MPVVLVLLILVFDCGDSEGEPSGAKAPQIFVALTAGLEAPPLQSKLR